MLTRATLRREDGSALITALMVVLVMLPIGLALLALVDTQARDSSAERTRDRAFNLADSALTSAAFNLGRFAWPASPASAPSNTSATGSAAACGTASFGATLGGATNPGSTTAKLQPNLNASYDDAAYAGATWQVNVCDDDPLGAGPTVWKDGLLARSNYDANANHLLWVRSEANVAGKRRVLAALVRAKQTPALSSRYGLMTGRLNSDVTTSVAYTLTGGALGDVVGLLLGSQQIVAADPSVTVTNPPSSGVTAVRCGALDGCLTGVLGGLGSLSAFDALVTGGKLVQATSPTATSAGNVAQLKQQAINSGTYVASTAGSASPSSPPACTIPTGASSQTVVYIEQVGTSGTAGSTGGPGDQFCVLDVSGGVAFKALVVGRGRVVLRGDDTASGGTFTGLVYALNEQRATLGDAAIPSREVVRIDKGAHVRGGVAADGKSAQVGVYPPTIDCLLGLPVLCPASILLGISSYNPAIRSNAAAMNAVTVYAGTSLVSGTYRDIAGEAR